MTLVRSQSGSGGGMCLPVGKLCCAGVHWALGCHAE